MKISASESDEHRLVFRRRSFAVVGLPLMLLGVSLVIGNGRHVIRFGDGAGDYLFGLVLGLALSSGGVGLMVGLRLVLDRSAREVSRTVRVLGFSRTRRWPLADFEAVGWSTRRESGGDGPVRTRYPVRLTGPRAILPILDALEADEARCLTREVGDFLGLRQEHGDAELEEWRAEVLRAQPAQVEMVRRFGSLRPMRPVFRSGSRLVYVKTAGLFLRLWGGSFALFGIFFLLLPAIGGTFNGRKDAFWGPIAAGSVGMAIGAICLLGRCGLTLDREAQRASRWWGMPWPVFGPSRDLPDFSRVRFETRVQERGEVPVETGRASLEGDDGREFLLVESIDVEHAEDLAREVAGFLGWGLSTGPRVR